MHAFGHAVLADDLEGMRAALAEDVVFRSPVAHRPYRGRDNTMVLLKNVTSVFEDFRYTNVIIDADGENQALVFEAKVHGKTVSGCDFIHINSEGLIDEFTVMVRPLNGLVELAKDMGSREEVLAVEKYDA